MVMCSKRKWEVTNLNSILDFFNRKLKGFDRKEVYENVFMNDEVKKT